MPERKQYKGPVCKGSWVLGNNCRICERCEETRPVDVSVTGFDDQQVEAVARAIHSANKDPEIYAWFHVDASKCRKSTALAKAALAAMPTQAATDPGAMLNDCIAELGDGPWIVRRDADGWCVRLADTVKGEAAIERGDHRTP